MRKLCLLLLIGLPTLVCAQDSLWVGVATNIRALSVVDSQHWWFGGSSGWLGRTADAGKSWELQQPAGTQVDFRSLYAFNAREAVAAIAGLPAAIYRTEDGGKQWHLVHEVQDDSLAFMDAIGFWNDTDGLLFGDPLADGRMLLLGTSDGGRSWHALPDSSRPIMQPGEAAFAASGTAMHLVGDSTVAIVSGGSRSRLFVSHNRGRSWEVIAADRWQEAEKEYAKLAQAKFGLMQHGSASRGAFSVGWSPQGEWVLTGGDYLQENLSEGHFLIWSSDHWWRVKKAPRGYRECVVFLDADRWVATGPSGSDVSWNGGLDWEPLNDYRGMHVVKKMGDGLLMAGKAGVMWLYNDLLAPAVPIGTLPIELDELQRTIAREVHKRRKPQKTTEGFQSLLPNQRELDSLIPLLTGVVALTVLPKCEIYGPGIMRSRVYAMQVNTHEGLQTVFLLLSERGRYHRFWFWIRSRYSKELHLQHFEVVPQLERGWKSKCDHIQQLGWKLAE